jgi:hypothetical protein
MSEKKKPDRKPSSPSTSGGSASAGSSSGGWSVTLPIGVGVALATGFVVFAAGASLFPVSRPLPPRAPIVAVPAAKPTPPALPATPPAALPAIDAQEPIKDGTEKASDAAAKGDTSADVGVAAKTPATKTPATKTPASKTPVDAAASTEESTEATTADAGQANASDAGNEPDPDCALAEKDIAREAWRRNWPTLCSNAETGKAFILIPIKGSIEKATSELKRKPVREARVNLPDAESQLTLKLYKLRRMGFKDLKLGPMDEGTGTRFRVRLQPGAGDPLFEIKETYAKITVAMPEKE